MHMLAGSELVLIVASSVFFAGLRSDLRGRAWGEGTGGRVRLRRCLLAIVTLIIPPRSSCSINIVRDVIVERYKWHQRKRCSNSGTCFVICKVFSQTVYQGRLEMSLHSCQRDVFCEEYALRVCSGFSCNISVVVAQECLREVWSTAPPRGVQMPHFDAQGVCAMLCAWEHDGRSEAPINYAHVMAACIDP
jgi:hypothetical protein